MRLARWSRPEAHAQRADVLIVCRANYTRSPLIAADLQRRVAGRLTIGSAGVLAIKPSRGVDRRLLPHASEVGVDPVLLLEHQPRQLTEQMVQAADLVIAATREVRGFIDTIAPGTTHRVYTLLELAQLLKEAPQSRGLGTLGVVELAMSRRTGGTLAQDANDLADPRGEAAEAYRIMVKTVSAALDVIAPALLPVPSTETSPGHS